MMSDVMATLDSLHKMALETNLASDPLNDVSHYKVNRKIYDAMKVLEHPNIIYRADFDTLILNKKPVFIDNELKDGIATYKHKELESNEPIDLYSANTITIRPRRIEPMRLMINI